MSLKYNGKECQDRSKFTHIGSGLGLATVTSKVSGTYATGQTVIYIGTYATAEPEIGELRFIARLSRAALPKGPTPPDDVGGITIEGSDFINDQVHGVTGSGVGAYMVMPENAYETSSRGPFMRDIKNQNSVSGQQEIYFCMNSGHMKTEDFRTGFFGPYALVFTSGTAPSGNLDTSFFSSLGLSGCVAPSNRGIVMGTVSGISSIFQATVVLKNSVAQYWSKVSSGSYMISGVKPVTYTATLFKKELEVGTGTVTVSSGKTSTLDLRLTESIKSTLWQIGAPDGTPSGFLFIAVNNPTTIKWTAASSQLGARTLRIRATSSFNGGRPTVKVNSWSSSSPAAPTKIDSRGVTRGTWRGYNQLYEFPIPAGTLVTGSNTFVITVISGNSGDAFLSPNIIYDSIELY
ncbi:hypothetical protein FRC07_000795 [Ceratobasidium sp. 392]|nr:hypothetical protein FRC07_000795 [Ceratobasidium sp. 392]